MKYSMISNSTDKTCDRVSYIKIYSMKRSINLTSTAKISNVYIDHRTLRFLQLIKGVYITYTLCVWGSALVCDI